MYRQFADSRNFWNHQRRFVDTTTDGVVTNTNYAIKVTYNALAVTRLWRIEPMVYGPLSDRGCMVSKYSFTCVLIPMQPLLTLIVCCAFVFSSAQAQTQAFSPAPEDQALLTGLSAKYKKNYQEELDKLPAKYRKDFLDVYAESAGKTYKRNSYKEEIYTSPSAQQYLDALVAEIRKSNPQLQNHPFTCYFSRSWVPNASYIGEGIILFNMGLFQRLNNESEVAFVLCHEIAHFLLQHPEKAIAKYVDAINSQEVQAELRKS